MRMKRLLALADVPVDNEAMSPVAGEDRRGPVREPILSIRSTGYGVFSTLGIDDVGVVCRHLNFGTSTPALAQLIPVAAEERLLLIPCKKNVMPRFTITWSGDRKRAGLRLRTVLLRLDVALPSKGNVLELPVQPYEHPKHGWSLSIATRGETRPEQRRSRRTPAQQA